MRNFFTVIILKNLHSDYILYVYIMTENQFNDLHYILFNPLNSLMTL